MNKQDVVIRVSLDTGLSYDQINKVFDSLTKIVTTRVLEEGKDVHLGELGVFKRQHSKATKKYTRLNKEHNGELTVIEIPPKHKVKWRTPKSLIKVISENG